MGDDWIQEFGSAFWLTIVASVFGFGGVCLQAVLKSRCKRFSCCCITCVRDPLPYGHEPDLNLSRIEHGNIQLESPKG